MKKLIGLCCVLLCQFASAQQGYYRSPTLQGDNVVFTAEGDLWHYSLKNSSAKRLTTHPAEEKQARISADGQWLAFTANYEGSTEVYVIALAGGVAKRVTFENSNVRLQGWHSDGSILYATNSRVGPTGNWTLKTVNPETFQTSFIPLADAIEGSIDEKNNTLFFTQFGLQVSSDNAKIYRGGAQGELWRFQLEGNKEAKLLTSKHHGDVRQPMYFDNNVYFISDASGADNIWQMNTRGEKLKQVTHFKEWPVRSAGLDENRIIFQQGADLKILDLASKNVTTLDIQLSSDLPNLREKWVNKPLKHLTSATISSLPKVAITARGKVAIASTDKSRLIEVFTPPTSRTRNAILSHDGQWVYAINDSSGELEIWQFAADGSDNAKQLTNDGNIFRWNMHLSPDGKKIAHDDKAGNLWLLDIDSGENKKLLENNDGLSPFQDVVWSSDSHYLALTRSKQKDQRSRIELFSIADNKGKLLTTDKYNAYSPAFSPDGQWLYFLSDRHFNATPSSPWGDRVMGAVFDRRSQIFAYPLTANAQFPFQPNNELLAAQARSDKEAKEQAKADSKSKDSSVTTAQEQLSWELLGETLWQVPVPSGNFNKLSVTDKHLYLLDRATGAGNSPSLHAIEIKTDAKLKSLVKDIADYQLTADNKQVFVRKAKSNQMLIVDANGNFPAKTAGLTVDTASWQLLINPQQEWQQIFHDAWLMHRDFLYDANMRGLDWQAVKAKYEPLLNRLTDRHELNDIFKQMMGELNALHSQVRGGDYAKDNSAAKTATLGAALKQTAAGVIVEHIYQTDSELPLMNSPLNQPGVDVNNNDIIESINGRKVTNIAQVNAALRNQTGKQVLLALIRGDNVHKTVVVPVSTRKDYQLRYQDWVNYNQTKVSANNTNIGYLHLHAMGGNDIASFAREFYHQINKEGLIIDVRRNRGGNIDSWIIEKLLRRVWMFWQSPIGEPSTNMQQTFRGHLVVLADQMTYSDGETFTAGIIANKLAPVIGKQTAGAGVWLRGANQQSDGGMARVAEFPVYAMDGRWIVEGHGVKPTIEVDNLPHETFNGKDAQLEAALKYLNKKLKKQPIRKMQPKAFPPVDQPADDIVK
ncbi:PDZ domain-containing protein [Colwellia sp. D2M02]|uniref:S41 family peptidase n=1 Tax=Colwellia sp. D2M02 TaxID=2841562 RepID=UPI001C0A25D8|nr:S41 family peptidase [Colwellia sp. D2M02]MBU2893692.1 PDZ domain-containing protein [Colwellia sp. D2M02]